MNNPKIQVLIEELKKRKVLVLAGSIVILFIVVVLLLLPQEQKNNKTLSTAQISISPTVNVSQDQTNAEQNAFPKWKNNMQESVSFQSPPEWMVRKAPVAAGGEYILVQPTILPPNIIYPRFTVETVPYNAESLAIKAEILRAFGLRESQITIDGIRARKFSGVMGDDITKSENLSAPLQETAILLHNNNKMYTIKYNYEAEQPNPELEDYFGEIIKTVTIK